MRWLLAPAALLTLLSCSPATSSPPTTVSAQRTASPQQSASASPQQTVDTESPCGRVVSALGFARLGMLPAGQEGRQAFDDDVRGRLAYVWGTVEKYGTQLPSGLQRQQETLRRTAKGLAPVSTPHDEQVRLLREYHQAAKALTEGCA